MSYKDMTIEDIIKWCQENKQVDWLKKTAAKEVEYKVYPRVKGEDGKYYTDKKAEPKIEMRPISFIQLKLEFVKEFMPEIAPKAQAKKPTMHERIANL